MKPDWETRRERRLRREKREWHAWLFTAAFWFAIVILCTVLDIGDGARDSPATTFLTFMSFLAAKGFWHWFMDSAFTDSIYDDRPKDRDI